MGVKWYMNPSVPLVSPSLADPPQLPLLSISNSSLVSINNVQQQRPCLLRFPTPLRTSSPSGTAK